MDANSGKPWSEMDIADLTYSLAHGNSFAEDAWKAGRSWRKLVDEAPQPPGGSGRTRLPFRFSFVYKRQYQSEPGEVMECVRLSIGRLLAP